MKKIAKLNFLLASAYVCAGLTSPPLARAENLLDGAPRPAPAKRVNYINWLQERPTPSQDNATDRYLSSFAYLSPLSNDADVQRATSGPWSDLADLETWLEKNDRGLRMFRNASTFTHLDLPFTRGSATPGGTLWADSLVFVNVGALGGFEVAADGLLIQGWRQWARGEESLIVDNVLTNLSVAHHLATQPAMVARMTGLNIAQRAYRATRRILAATQEPEVRAETLVQHLSDWDVEIPSLENAYHFQQLTSWDLLQRMYSADGHLLDPTTEAIYQHLVNQTNATNPTWEESRAAIEDAGFEMSMIETSRFFEGLLEWNRIPYHAALAHVNDFESLAANFNNPMMGVFLSGLTTPRQAWAAAEAARRGTHLVAHILFFAQKRGQFPDSLADLGRNLPPEIKIDPYSGRDMIYARRRDGFVLYSIGLDLKDDGGRPPLRGQDAGDIVYWPIEQESRERVVGAPPN